MEQYRLWRLVVNLTMLLTKERAKGVGGSIPHWNSYALLPVDDKAGTLPMLSISWCKFTLMWCTRNKAVTLGGSLFYLATPEGFNLQRNAAASDVVVEVSFGLWSCSFSPKGTRASSSFLSSFFAKSHESRVWNNHESDDFTVTHVHLK